MPEESQIVQPEAEEFDPELLRDLLKVPIVDNLRKYGGFTPHPDERIRRNGVRGMEYVTKILKDNHLSSCIETRANNALVPGYAIDTVNGDERGAEFIRYCLREMDRPFPQILKAVQVNSMSYGNEVEQRIWKQIESGPFKGMWKLHTLKPIPQELVKFDHDETGAIKPDGIVISPSPTVMDSGKELRYSRAYFLHAIWGYTYNPYGQSLALECDQWVWAKDILNKFRLVHAEKFGSPSIQAKLTRQIKRGTQEWNDVMNLLLDMQQNSAFIVPVGVVVEMLQSNRSGDLDFDNAYDRGNKEISKKILGSTAVSEGASRGQAGGYAQAKVMGGTTDNYAWIDALWLENIAQRQIIEPLWYMNFGYETLPPQIRILDDDYARMVATSNIVMSLTQAGAKIPEAWVFQQLKIPQPKPGERVLQVASGFGSPAGPDNKGLDNNLFRAGNIPPASAGGNKGGVYFATSGRDTVLNGIEQDSFQIIGNEVRDLFESCIQAVETMPEGEPISTPPQVELVAQKLNTAISRGLWQHYLTGKFFATRELEMKLPEGTEIPGVDSKPPKLKDKFKSLFSSRPRSYSPKALAIAAKFRAKFSPPAIAGGIQGGVKFSASDPALPEALLSAAESLKLIGQTIPVTPEEVQKVAAYFQELGQSVAGVIESDIRTIFEKLALGQKNGWSVRDFQAAIREAGIKYAGDVFGRTATGEELAGHHVETIYRNHMMRAFADGKDSLAEDPEVGDIVAGFKFVSTDDDRTRPLHTRLNGIALPKNHAKWRYLKPPIFHNCRCDREFVTIFEIEDGTVTWTPDSDLPSYDPNQFF